MGLTDNGFKPHFSWIAAAILTLPYPIDNQPVTNTQSFRYKMDGSFVTKCVAFCNKTQYEIEQIVFRLEIKDFLILILTSFWHVKKDRVTMPIGRAKTDKRPIPQEDVR